MARAKYSTIFLTTAVMVLFPLEGGQSFPTVYPTGVTIYQPDRAWNGYTIFGDVDALGAFLIDMNGTELRHWPEYLRGPIRILPGGHVMGGDSQRDPYNEAIALTHRGSRQRLWVITVCSGHLWRRQADTAGVGP